LRGDRGLDGGVIVHDAVGESYNARADVFEPDIEFAQSEQAGPKGRREAWFASQLDLDPDKLVFIDETWTTTNMARKNGHAPKPSPSHRIPDSPAPILTRYEVKS
jgi:hypothetical protein